MLSAAFTNGPEALQPPVIRVAVSNTEISGQTLLRTSCARNISVERILPDVAAEHVPLISLGLAGVVVQGTPEAGLDCGEAEQHRGCVGQLLQKLCNSEVGVE
jgi:hypothetical protein